MDKHPRSRSSLETWYQIAKKSQWSSPARIKGAYGNASIIGNNRVVFNIHGNEYRLIVEFNYEKGFGYIKFACTHKEYGQVDAELVNFRI